MPLNSPTTRSVRVARIAAVAGMCVAAGFSTAAIADEQPAPQANTVGQTALTRYFDIEANKADSMLTLGARIVARRAPASLRYDDLEANKARNQRAR